MKALAEHILPYLKIIDAIVTPVWLLLGALMVLAGYLVYQKNGFSYEVALISLLLFATFSYPLYTFGYKLVPALVANIVYVFLVLYIIRVIQPISNTAGLFLVPIVIWVMAAALYVAVQLLAQ